MRSVTIAVGPIIFAVCLLACIVPARRALQVDPIAALRAELGLGSGDAATAQNAGRSARPNRVERQIGRATDGGQTRLTPMPLKSIREWMGLRASGSTESTPLRQTLDALDHLEPDRARHLAAFAYLLGRVAHADQHVAPEETRTMEVLLQEHGHLTPDQAMVVVQLAKSSHLLFGGTSDFLVAREFAAHASYDEKLALLNCLFAVSASEACRFVRVAGAVIVRQRPGTAKGFVFLTMEDETGLSNVIITPDTYQTFKRVVVDEPYLLVEGTLQNQDGAVSVKAQRIESLKAQTPEQPSRDFH